eukprot:3620733-Amphidinium_carterae.1
MKGEQAVLDYSLQILAIRAEDPLWPGNTWQIEFKSIVTGSLLPGELKPQSFVSSPGNALWALFALGIAVGMKEGDEIHPSLAAAACMPAMKVVSAVIEAAQTAVDSYGGRVCPTSVIETMVRDHVTSIVAQNVTYFTKPPATSPGMSSSNVSVGRPQESAKGKGKAKQGSSKGKKEETPPGTKSSPPVEGSGAQIKKELLANFTDKIASYADRSWFTEEMDAFGYGGIDVFSTTPEDDMLDVIQAVVETTPSFLTALDGTQLVQ